MRDRVTCGDELHAGIAAVKTMGWKGGGEPDRRDYHEKYQGDTRRSRSRCGGQLSEDIAMRLVITVAIAVLMAGCGGAHPTEPDPRPGLTPLTTTAEWPVSSPSVERVDETRIDHAVTRIRRGDYGGMSSLLIARNGRLIVEEYFGGMVAERAHRSEEHTSELQSQSNLVCRLLLEKKKKE